MANPTSNWDKIPVYGVYLRAPDDTPEPGTIVFTLANRITRTDGRVIYPAGAKVSRVIGDTATQDSTVRSVVRAAWRAADEAELGEDFDGVAWDSWWDDVIVPAAVFTAFPALDDPDIVNDPDNRVFVEEQLASATGKKYPIQPLLAHLDLAIPGVNLGTIEVPPGSPTVPAPVYAKGIAGGVASLDGTGKVPVEQLPSGIGGGIPEGADLDEIGDSSTRLALLPAERTKLADLPLAATLTSQLAAKAADSGVIHTSGAETKNGVLTFGSIPVLPASDPTTANQATRKSYVDAAITAAVAGVLNSAPGALDTLNELAAALGNDPNFSTTIINALALRATLASPTFTGTVTVPAPTNATDAATKGYVDGTTARGTAGISAAGNTNVAAPAGARHYEVGVSVSAFAGTATIALQSTGAQAGDRRSVRLQVADGAGTIELRSLTSGGTLLATIPPNGSGVTVGYQVMSTYSGSAWSVGAVIPEQLLQMLGEIQDTLADLSTNYVTTAALSSAVAAAFAALLATAPYKFLLPGWILEATEDETDLPSGFPTAPIVTGGPDPLVLRRKA